jgi:hypothetical protein
MESPEIDELKNKAFKNSLTISVLYVGLGTLAVLSVYPASPLSGGWVIFALLLTLPVSVVGFGLMYADKDGYLLAFLAQVVTFLIFWVIVYRILLKKYRKQARESES